MTAYQIIDKYNHMLKNPTMIFYIWLCSRYPDGVLRKKIILHYSHMSESAINKYLADLCNERLIRYEEYKSEYSKVIPCP